MEIIEAILIIEELVEVIDRDGFAQLDSSDRNWLLKASAALGACKDLGGR